MKIYTERLAEEVGFEMVFVDGGIFEMGSEDSEALEREKPIHKVQVDDFYIGRFPVTQAIWMAVMGPDNNPSFFKGNQRPIENISWEDCQKFTWSPKT